MPAQTLLARISSVPTIAWVGAVAILASITQLVLTGNQPFAWDETIYISQNADGIPPAYLSAPRSRGTSWLVWPIAHFTTDQIAINVYLSILSAILLTLALYPWTKFLPKGVVILAAFLFAFLWTSLMFGSSAFPNYWLALACLSAVGWFIVAANRKAATSARWPIVFAAVSVLIAAVFRFSDTLWLVAALVGCAIVVPAWRRKLWLMASICGGFLIGCVPWLVESFISFGGPLARLKEASAIQGGTSLDFNVLNVLRAASGPRILCRPCKAAVSDTVLLIWLVAAILVVLALVVAWRNRDRRVIFVPTVCAVAVAIPYLFLLHYSAPRFMLPVFALIVIPIAYAIGWLCRPSRARPYVVTVVALALAANVVFQVQSVQASVKWQSKRGGKKLPALAADITAHGITPPCVVTGPGAPPIGFYTHCMSVATKGPNKNVTQQQFNDLIAKYPAAFSWRAGTPVPDFAQGWKTFTGGNGSQKWTVYYNIPTG